MALSSRLLRPAAALLASASALVLAACGGSGGDPNADPAAIVPARAAVYIEANLNPGDEIEELARKLSGEQEPGRALKRFIEQQAREDDPDFRFSEDVDPWLGERAGLFVPQVAPGDDSPVGAVFPTEDKDKAKEALERELREGEEGEPKPQVVERTHRGTKYAYDSANDEGVLTVGDYAIFGSDAALKGAIDAREGESLAESGEYERARDAVKDDDAGFMYLRISQILSGLGPQGAAARQVLQGFGDTVAVGLDGDASSLTVTSASLGVSGEGGPTGSGEVLGELPSSAWVAFGAADVGDRIEQAIQQLSQLGALGGQDPEQILEQLRAQLGIDPRRDLAAWLGDIGVFVLGDTPAEVGGGLVATTTDADATRRSIPRIARFLQQVAGLSARPLQRGGIDTGVTLSGPRVPLPIHMALTDDERFLVVVSDQALAQTLQDTDALGESQEFRDAAGRLGEGIEPSVFMNFAPLPGFIQATGAAGGEDAQQLMRVLERLTTLAAGTSREGDTARGRLVVGVK